MQRTGRFEWSVVFLFVLLAAFSRSPALIVLGAGGLVLGGVVWLTARLALVALEASVEVSADHVVAGEGITATVRIANRKPLPLPWLDLRLFLPEGIAPDKAGVIRAVSQPKVDVFGKPFRVAEFVDAINKLMADSAT